MSDRHQTPANAGSSLRHHLGAARRGALVVLALAALLFGATASAQEDDVDVVLDRIATAARELEDVTFMLLGQLVNTDGTTIALEVEIMVIPSEGLANAYIIQPDALADNMIILDRDTVYNYTFLTNQVMVFDADDPDALGGLLPSGDDGATASVSFDLGQIFAGYDAEIGGTFDGPFGETLLLNFRNIDENALILDVDADVPKSDWLPRRLAFVQGDGHVLAELFAEDLVANSGLDAAYLRELPDDAEVIDNRR